MTAAANNPLLAAAEQDFLLLENCRIERHLVHLLLSLRYPPSVLKRGCCRYPASAHRRIERAAVEQQVLADDEPGAGAAQKGAGVAELGGVADPAGRVRLAALGDHFVERNVLPPRLVFDTGTQPVGQERAGQEAVDRHIVS